MCIGGGGGAARDAREAEDRMRREAEEREARIREGQTAIDSAFGQYNDGYYGNYANSIVNYQQPQLQDQFNNTRGKLVAALAGRGMLESTTGANQTAKLGQSMSENTALIANQARDEAQALQGRVENQKSDLYALNQASADPQSISAQAIGQATAIAAPSAVSPIGQVFEGALAPYIAYQTSQRNSAGRPYQSNAPVASGRGSSRTVGR